MDYYLGELIVAFIGVVCFIVKHFYDKNQYEQVAESLNCSRADVDMLRDKIRVINDHNTTLARKVTSLSTSFEEGRKAFKSLNELYEKLQESTKAKKPRKAPAKKTPVKRTRKPRAKKE